MTTDLTGDFGLGEEEFDWDVFLPDPDEAEIAAAAAARENEDELALDDSHLDWEAALRDEPEVESDGRAGAAYERIVDTVRRSFEDRESETGADATSLPGREPSAVEPAGRDDEELELGPEFELELGDDFELDLGMESEWEAETEAEPEAETEAEAETDATAEPHAEFLAPPAGDTMADPWPGAEVVAEVFEPEPEPDEHPAWAAERNGAEAPILAASPALAPAEMPIPPQEPEPALVPPPPAPAGHEEAAAPDAGPAHARAGQRRDTRERSKVFTATVVLACLALVALAATLAVRSLHHAATPTTSTPARAASRVPSTAAAARLASATDAVDSATAEARAGIADMTSFPTPSSVARIVDPYIASLQLYETVLSASKVPAAATSEATTAAAEARQDLTFLDTIEGLPPLQLGAFLGRVGAETAQLQATLGGLRQTLRSSAS